MAFFQNIFVFFFVFRVGSIVIQVLYVLDLGQNTRSSFQVLKIQGFYILFLKKGLVSGLQYLLQMSLKRKRWKRVMREVTLNQKRKGSSGFCWVMCSSWVKMVLRCSVCRRFCRCMRSVEMQSRGVMGCVIMIEKTWFWGVEVSFTGSFRQFVLQAQILIGWSRDFTDTCRYGLFLVFISTVRLMWLFLQRMSCKAQLLCNTLGSVWNWRWFSVNCSLSKLSIMFCRMFGAFIFISFLQSRFCSVSFYRLQSCRICWTEDSWFGQRFSACMVAWLLKQ